MSNDVTNDLIYEILKDLQKGQSDIKETHRLTNERLSAIEHHIAGFHLTLSTYNDEVSSIKLRLDKLEKRMELRD